MANNDKAAALKRARRANIEAKSAVKIANDARKANYLHEVVWNHPVVATFLSRTGIVFREGEPPAGKGPEHAPIVAVVDEDYGVADFPVSKRLRLVALLEEHAGWLVGKRGKASALAAKIEVMLTKGPEKKGEEGAGANEGEELVQPAVEAPAP